MARIRLHDVADSDWRMIDDWASDEIRAQISDLERASSIREHEHGSPQSLQLFEVKFLPHTLVDVHAHDGEEIIYVVGGEMILGNRILTAGSSIYIQGSTLYGFRAGPEGLRVLNFRPRTDATYVPAEDFAEARFLAREAAHTL